MGISDSYLKRMLGKNQSRIVEKSDRDGLWVRVSKKGTVTFFFRYRYLGKQDKITIGNYPTLTLKKAREDVAKWQVILANGDNPKTVKNLIIKEKITELTFEELFRKWYSVIFESKISAPLILRSFEIHVFPHFGKYPISAITIHNWISLLDKLSKKYSEITKRVLSNARKCYSWAEKRQMVSCNPLIGINSSDFGIKKGTVDRVLSDSEIKLFWNACYHSRIVPKNKIMLKLCLIYGCRIAELRLAKRSDFDFEKMLWTVPPENHKTGGKTGRPLVRPIIPQILPMLNDIHHMSYGEYLFSNNNLPLSPGFHLKLSTNIRLFILRNYKENIPHFTVHDLRRTARTNFSEITQPHVAEIMLGHKLPGIWGIYDKYQYINEMRDAYNKWWDKLMQIVA